MRASSTCNGSTHLRGVQLRAEPRTAPRRADDARRDRGRCVDPSRTIRRSPQAAAHAATPQLRNAATIGGNLLQRPRCWYFRNELFHAAREEVGREQSQYGAIFDNAKTTMVHASTPATALLAYGASVHVVGKQGKSRTIALGDFLLPPDFDRDRDTTLGHDEVLTHVSVPPVAGNTRAAYHKQTERDSYDWPICDVAVVLTLRRIARSRRRGSWPAPSRRSRAG